MKLHLILLSIFMLFSLFFLTEGSEAAPECVFRSGSCNAGEVCIFSVFQENNSHVGNCSYYSTSVCCNETTTVAIRSSCNAGEGIVFSTFQENNSHVGHNDYYSTKVCARFANNPVVINVRSSCLSGEACLASKFQDNNTHVGTCTYYSDNRLCLRELLNVTITINLNTTTPSWNEGVRATGRATRDGGSTVDTNANDLNIYLNGTLYCTNETDSNGDYVCDLSAPSTLGIYGVNVTIVDPTTSRTWYNTSSSFTIRASFGEAATSQSEAGSVSCYEEPRVVQNPDGTLKIAYVRVCISK